MTVRRENNGFMLLAYFLVNAEDEDEDEEKVAVGVGDDEPVAANGDVWLMDAVGTRYRAGFIRVARTLDSGDSERNRNRSHNGDRSRSWSSSNDGDDGDLTTEP